MAMRSPGRSWTNCSASQRTESKYWLKDDAPRASQPFGLQAIEDDGDYLAIALLGAVRAPLQTNVNMGGVHPGGPAVRDMPAASAPSCLIPSSPRCRRSRRRRRCQEPSIFSAGRAPRRRCCCPPGEAEAFSGSLSLSCAAPSVRQNSSARLVGFPQIEGELDGILSALAEQFNADGFQIGFTRGRVLGFLKVFAAAPDDVAG